MSDYATAPSGKSWADKLQAVPRQWLFLILLLCATIPLFIPVALPDDPLPASIDFYSNIMSLKPGDKVLVCSDWTYGTRGESGSQMEALLRILIRRGIKFVVYSISDPQNPQIFRETIDNIAKQEHAHGEPLYKPFQDYVICGYFANAEGTTTTINSDVKKAFAGVKDLQEDGTRRDVLESPVFQGINSVADFKYLVMDTATNTERITFQRVKNTKLMFMVTGVMVVEDNNYYQSGQLKGLVGGLKGSVDLEKLMKVGINTTDPATVKRPGMPTIPGFPGMVDEDRGTKYYFALHVCFLLMIVCVLIGNLGLLLSKGRKRA